MNALGNDRLHAPLNLSLWWTPAGWRFRPPASAGDYHQGGEVLLADIPYGEPAYQSGVPIYPVVSVTRRNGAWLFEGAGFDAGDWEFFVSDDDDGAFRDAGPLNADEWQTLLP